MKRSIAKSKHILLTLLMPVSRVLVFNFKAVFSCALVALCLLVGSSAAQEDPLVITPGGNVGIGTASPTQKLDVRGDATVTNQLTSGSLKITRGSLEVTGTSRYARFYNSAGRQTASVGTASDGNGGAWFFNKDGRTVVEVGAVNGTAGHGFQRFYNATGTLVATTGSYTSGNGAANFYNKDGKKVVEVGAVNGTAGHGYQRIYNATGTLVATIGAASNSGNGFGQYFSMGGKKAVTLGANDDGTGYVTVSGRTVHDFAEVFEFATRSGVVPGTVMAVSDQDSALELSTTAYDARVVGVVAGAGGLKSGMSMGSRDDGSTDLPIALAGQVYVRVCLEGGVIKPGDLVVASSQPGVAMRAGDRVRAIGAVIGKALEGYTGGREADEGLLRILVMVR